VGIFSALGSTLAFLVTPMGILIGLAVALAGYFLWSSGAIGAAFAHSPARRADGVVDLPPEQWRRMPDPELPDRRDETPKR